MINIKSKSFVFLTIICIVMYSEVYFTNEGYYLDDVVVKYEDKGKRFKTLEKFKHDNEIFEQVMIKRFDWSRCQLSSKFLDKYNDKDSIFK